MEIVFVRLCTLFKSQPDARSSGIGLYRFPAEGSKGGNAFCAWSGC